MSPSSPAVTRLIRTLVGSSVSVFFIWLVLRGRDLGAIWQATREANLGVLAPYLLILLLIHLLRTLRWGILLEGVGRPCFWRLNHASAVGFMALVLLPFRLGELARPYLISERATRGRAGTGTEAGGPDPEAKGLRMSTATASIVIERLVDGFFVSAFLLLALLLTLPAGVALRPEVAHLRLGATLVASLFATAGVLLLLLAWQRQRAVALCSRLVSLVSVRLATRVVSSLEHFIGGAATLPGPGRFLLFLLMTAAYWGVNGAGLALLARGFGLGISLPQAFTVLGVLVIGVMIPAGPGMVGTFQFFVLLGLGLFLPKELVDRGGVAYANLLWAMQFTQQVGLGLIFALRRPVSLKGLLGGAG